MKNYQFTIVYTAEGSDPAEAWGNVLEKINDDIWENEYGWSGSDVPDFIEIPLKEEPN